MRMCVRTCVRVCVLWVTLNRRRLRRTKIQKEPGSEISSQVFRVRVWGRGTVLEHCGHTGFLPPKLKTFVSSLKARPSVSPVSRTDVSWIRHSPTPVPE